MTLSRRIISGMLFSFAVAAANAAEPQSEYWIRDAGTGCLAANPAPHAGEHISWSGVCENGFISGQGVLTWHLGEHVLGRDRGTFAEGALTGHGVIESAEGWSYEGEFPGSGVLRLANGQEFPAQTMRENTGWRIAQVHEQGL